MDIKYKVRAFASHSTILHINKSYIDEHLFNEYKYYALIHEVNYDRYDRSFLFANINYISGILSFVQHYIDSASLDELLKISDFALNHRKEVFSFVWYTITKHSDSYIKEYGNTSLINVEAALKCHLDLKNKVEATT